MSAVRDSEMVEIDNRSQFRRYFISTASTRAVLPLDHAQARGVELRYTHISPSGVTLMEFIATRVRDETQQLCVQEGFFFYNESSDFLAFISLNHPLRTSPSSS